jgi:Flp pilus assembly pilin Flp
VKNGLKQLYTDETGAEMVEWAILTLLVALAGYAMLLVIRGQLDDVFNRLLDRFIG